MVQKLISKRRIIGVWLVILLLTSFSISYAISNIAVFLFLLYFLIDTKTNIKTKFRAIWTEKTNMLFMLLFVAQIIGIFYSENTDFAITRATVMLPLLFLPAILSVEKFTKKEFNFIISICKITIILPFIYFILLHLIWDKRNISTFVHFTISNNLGISQFYLIFILFIPVIASISALIDKQKTFFHLVLLSISLGIIFLLGNKTSAIFVVLFWIMLIVQTYNRKKTKALIPIVTGVLIFVLALQLPIVNQRLDVFRKTVDFNLETVITKNSFTITKNTFEHRLLIDYLALHEILDSLPFGVGTGDFQAALNAQYQRINFKAALDANYNAHNQYISEFLKTGILGGTIFVILIILLLKKINRHQKYYAYFITFFSLACLVESYLDRQHGIVIFAFLIPFLLYNDNHD